MPSASWGQQWTAYWSQPGILADVYVCVKTLQHRAPLIYLFHVQTLVTMVAGLMETSIANRKAFAVSLVPLLTEESNSVVHTIIAQQVCVYIALLLDPVANV